VVSDTLSLRAVNRERLVGFLAPEADAREIEIVPR
jgi:hypothetical protein